MASISFGCGIASSLMGTDRQGAAAMAVSFSPSSSVFGHGIRRAAVVPAKLRGTLRVVEACAVQAEKKQRGIMRPRLVSPEMQEIVGVPEISRTEAVKRIWNHIKQNNLQDPNDKRIIVCDQKLKKIFAGKERVKFLEISGLITPHFL